MRIRTIELEDAPFMLEWMHDKSVVENMQTDFISKTLENCIEFIKTANGNNSSLHMAIVDDNNEYQGTVSLKNINSFNAEFAITIRKKAMGTGCAQFGMKEILKWGFDNFNLEYIYWCVSSKNLRAIRFYNKGEYEICNASDINIHGYTEEQIKEYLWYRITKDSFLKMT